MTYSPIVRIMHIDLSSQYSGDASSPKEFPVRRFRFRRTKGNRVLMFGNNRELALYRAIVLSEHGYAVAIPNNREEAATAIRKGNFDIAVLTYTLPNETVQELAQLVRDHCPECPLIIIAKTPRMDREIGPDEIVDGDEGPTALLSALRRVALSN